MKSKLLLLNKSLLVVAILIVTGIVACSRQKNISKDKITEAPSHNAPDQDKIDSIKASYNKKK
ncbi:MAG TPA: hypothetical protein PKN57_01595 [Saprospiraceae bacterium]|nr:hypothetical protein [Saprospiraceae bacterium]MCC6688091.1 hypothetical protein [Saprospiraceae bacterium]HMV22754.1 hypothetical protein [Saprospiraceae bacterium]HMX81801.1 hypothetical protein [Saprospiraceae bacterium]HMX84302.1 hypothetical protein [Saprospiraceae bacterium]